MENSTYSLHFLTRFSTEQSEMRCGVAAIQVEYRDTSSSSRSSDGNSSLPNEGGSSSQVPQASVQLAGYGSVVWPDSLSEWLV